MRDVVALVPGFLGFNHLDSWTYWADRFLAGLRCQLEARHRGPIPVVPTPAPGIGSLAERQGALLAYMTKLEQVAFHEPCRWHFVGHSTGGVDAALLARTHALEESGRGSVFSRTIELPPLAIGSITTISAPHYGSCLALAPLARLRLQDATLAGVEELVGAGIDLFMRRDKSLAARVKFALGSALQGSAIKFVHDLVVNDRLARDLAPSICATLTRTANRRPGVPIYCIATMAPEPSADLKDKLFLDLWRMTQENAVGAEPAAPAIDWSSARVIASQGKAGLRPTSPRDSDGVVNTDRQIDRDGDAKLAGLVIGDHGDVLGLYQRADPVDKKDIQPGLLTSGADFGDDQFFEMLGLIAQGILQNLI
jgi:hypothetical protein